jgi:hypothetical protein
VCGRRPRYAGRCAEYVPKTKIIGSDWRGGGARSGLAERFADAALSELVLADNALGVDANHHRTSLAGKTAGQRHDRVSGRHTFTTLQAEEHHRDHAQAGQVFADLADGPLAHLPSGSFPANAAWLACAAIAHNLLSAAGSLASLTYAKARAATLRRDLISVAARTARHGRGHITLHLPQDWHRETGWMTLFDAACGPPATAA